MTDSNELPKHPGRTKTTFSVPAEESEVDYITRTQPKRNEDDRVAAYLYTRSRQARARERAKQIRRYDSGC